jgi:RNA polymerase sigma factor (sigma-70 family)
VAEQTTQERDDWQAPEQSEQYTMVMTVLDEQPETTKEIVRLRFFEQLTFEQIAEQLGIGVTTAKDRVRKAIGAVQERVTVECCE